MPDNQDTQNYSMHAFGAYFAEARVDEDTGEVRVPRMTGVFAVEAYGGQPGLFDGNAVQVLNQLYGILIVFVYDAIVSLIILKIVDIFIGLRVSDEVEREGLDLALHGETVH